MVLRAVRKTGLSGLGWGRGKIWCEIKIYDGKRVVEVTKIRSSLDMYYP